MRLHKSAFHSLVASTIISILLTSCGGTSIPLKQQESGSLAPGLKWKVELGTEINGNLVLSNGLLYATTYSSLSVLDTSTGATKLTIDPPGSSLSSPAVANDMVFVGSTRSTRGLEDDARIQQVFINAFSTQTGKELWTRELSNNRNFDASNPIVASGVVYIGTGWSDYSCCDHRGGGGLIAAFTASTGDLLWQKETIGSYESGGIPTTTFNVLSNTLYLGTGYRVPDLEDNHLRALDSSTGSELWSIPSTAPFPSVAQDGNLYVVSETQLLSIDGATGRQNWQWQPGSSDARLSVPSVGNNVVYIVANDDRPFCIDNCPPPTTYTDTLYALNSSTGKELWKQDMEGDSYGTRNLFLFQDYICFEISDDTSPEHTYLRAVHRDSGQFAWQYEVDSSFYSSPTILNNTIYLGTYKGTIYALQLPNTEPSSP